ncbi:hypothetical protein I6E50_05025 [Roseburia hominis]|uniref:hypothetical protein n=1 Tax=Roseburia hominis TaxID=301301 RepID=UPI001F2BA374|nr:hypothetical protein [Roseburia hominis]
MNLTINAAFSSSFYLRSFYSSNRSAASTDSYRSKASNYTLLSADTNAIHNAVKKLSSMDFDDEENQGDIDNSISAFVSTYNNLIESSGSSDANSVRIARNHIKSIAKDYEEQLKEIGLTLNSKGTLKLDRDTLSEASLKKLKSLFSDSDDSDSFIGSIKKHSKSIQNYIRKHPPVTKAAPDSLDSPSQINLLI